VRGTLGTEDRERERERERAVRRGWRRLNSDELHNLYFSTAYFLV
jgi:hypothetical protein